MKSNSPHKTNPQINQFKRKSSWSLMKNFLKGVNGLRNPQVLFIENEVFFNLNE